jgi:beta-lactamase class A
MIMTSDNTATRIMVKKLGGVSRINEWLQRNGYTQTKAGPIEEGWRPILELIDPEFATITVEEAHGLLYAAWGSHQFELYESHYVGEKRRWLDRVSDKALDAAFKAYADRPDLWYGTMTPRETGKMLEAIAHNTIASKESCDRMQAIMRLQKSGACRIPHYLDVPVAHKTGDLPPSVANDVGIVYANSGQIIISFFTMDIEEPYGELEDRIGRLARKVVDYFDEKGSK